MINLSVFTAFITRLATIDMRFATTFLGEPLDRMPVVMAGKMMRLVI